MSRTRKVTIGLLTYVALWAWVIWAAGSPPRFFL